MEYERVCCVRGYHVYQDNHPGIARSHLRVTRNKQLCENVLHVIIIRCHYYLVRNTFRAKFSWFEAATKIFNSKISRYTVFNTK